MTHDSFTIFITVCREDALHAYALCESIRYFNPRASICLIPDKGACIKRIVRTYPDIVLFDDAWVPHEVLDALKTRPGYYRKIVELFQTRFHRFLHLDADIVALNDLFLLYPDACRYDFYVDNEELYPNGIFAEECAGAFFDPQNIAQYDDEFTPSAPMRFFNVGHFWGTAGKIPISTLFKGLEIEDAIGMGDSYDQGLINYLLLKEQQAGNLTIGGKRFMTWAHEDRAVWPEITCENIMSRSITRTWLLHWAGTKRWYLPQSIPYSDIYTYFLKRFYGSTYINSAFLHDLLAHFCARFLGNRRKKGV